MEANRNAAAVSFGWQHWTVVGLLQQASPALENQLDFKEAEVAEAQGD